MTAQAREIIYINGKEEQMAAEPLQPFIKTHPEISFRFSSTDCWRGYYGTWLLERDKLYLIKLEGHIEGLENDWIPVDLDYLFPNQKKVFAKWYSGTIKVEIGNLLEYVHMGYASKYEQDLFLVFEDGVKVDEYFIDNTRK